MRILSLTLRNYRRLALSGIKEIIIKPQEKLHLILGTNGSGKTSLLRELSPLPADKKDFYINGYKEIEIDSNQRHYVLISDFTKGSKYSFLENGTELNNSNNISIQKSLVESVFKIDSFLHNLLMSSVSFISLSFIDRRNLLARISNIDYDFVISVYNRFKDKYNSSIALIKYIQTRLAQENENMLDKELISILNKNAITAKEELDYLFGLKRNVTSQEETIQQLDITLKNTSKQLIKTKQYLQSSNIPISATIDIDLKLVKQEQLQYVSLIDKLKERIIGIEKINNQSIEDIVSKINILDTEYKDIAKHIVFPDIIIGPSHFDSLFITAEFINKLLSNIPLDVNINIDTQLQYQQLLLNKHQLIKDNIRKVNLVIQRYDDLKKNHISICPNCNHTWIPGYDEIEYNRLKQQHNLMVDNLQTNELELQKTNELISIAQEVIDKYRAYKAYTEQYKVFKPLWDYIDSNRWVANLTSSVSRIESINNIISQPSQIISFINDILKDTKTRKILNTIIEQKKELESILNIAKQQLSINVNELLKQKEEYTNKLSELQLAETNLSRQLEVYNNYQEANLLTDKVKQLMHTRELLVRQYIENKLQQDLDNEINKAKEQLRELDILTADITNKENIIKDLTTQLQLNTNIHIALKAILLALSPTDGLIAKSLNGFINIFLEDINNILNSIWSYPLRLSIADTDNDNAYELSYRFLLHINNEYTISDISKASSAMKEVINLAFTITVMQYLGLNEYPLYLDEFGHSMDKVHRKMAYAAINTLVNASNFSHVFLISHYDDLYGSIRNADISVLCNNNITVPEHLQINKCTYIVK